MWLCVVELGSLLLCVDVRGCMPLCVVLGGFVCFLC